MFMYYWAGLYQDEMHDRINEGTETLMQAALSIKERTASPAQPGRITYGREQDTNRREEEQHEVLRSNEEEQSGEGDANC
jgi:hypothetical protein